MRSAGAEVIYLCFGVPLSPNLMLFHEWWKHHSLTNAPCVSAVHTEGMWDVCLQQEWVPNPKLVCIKSLIPSRNNTLAAAGDGNLGTP